MSTQAGPQVVLEQLARPISIALDSAEWNCLFNKAPAVFFSDSELLRTSVAPLCRKLVQHNPTTSNFQGLVIQTKKLLDAASSGASVTLAENALSAVCLVLQHLAATQEPKAMLGMFQLQSDVAGGTTSGTGDEFALCHSFIESLLTVAGRCEVSQQTQALLCHALVTLVVCCSTQLYVGPEKLDPSSHYLLQVLLHRQAGCALTIRRLLLLYMHQNTSQQTQTLFSYVTAGAFSRGPSSSAQSLLSLKNALAKSTNPLSDLAVFLLVLLIYQTDEPPEIINHYRDSWQLLSDGDYSSDVELGASHALSQPGSSVSFSRLFEHICNNFGSETTTLLLYTLLYECRPFLEYVLARTDPEILILPLAKTLYSCTKQNARHIYMLQIILLILTQDQVFKQSIHTLKIPQVPWYKEQKLATITLGSLLYIVLIRSVLNTYSATKEVYLPTNALAAMVNMAPFFNGMHFYTAYRLVDMCCVASKKYLKMSAKDPLAPPPLMSSAIEQHNLEELLCFVLDIITRILTTSLHRNLALMYALLNREGDLSALQLHPRMTQHIDVIKSLIQYFSARVDEARAAQPTVNWNATKVMGVIEVAAVGRRYDQDDSAASDLRFMYQQQPQPHLFFLPYIWAIILGDCQLGWDSAAVKLTQPNNS